MGLKQLANAEYIALETFRKNGTGVVTPVWVVGDETRLLVWTEASSWKVKRIGSNPQVRLAESDARGNPRGEWVSGRAQVFTDTETVQQVKQLLKEKYGLMFSLFNLMGKLRRQPDPRIAVAITA